MHEDTNLEILLHQENLEQRRHWKVLSFALMFVVAVLMALVCYLAVKVSEKREVVRYVEFSTKGNFGFKVLTNSNINITQKKLLIEQQLQQYIIKRVSNVASKKHSSDDLDANDIKLVNALSSKEVYFQYESELMRIYNESDFVSRKIHILSFNELEDRRYRFDFNTIDTLPDGTKSATMRWVVHVRYDLIDPNDIKTNDHKELNPLGIKITSYRGDLDTQQKLNIEDVTK